MRFRTFIQDRGEVVRFESVREPTGHFSSVIDVFEQALDQERAVTQYINYLYALAQDEKDFATQSFHNWFVDEQLDEEKSVMGIIDWIRTLGDSAQGIYLLDRELGGSLEPTALPMRELSRRHLLEGIHLIKWSQPRHFTQLGQGPA